MQENFLHFLSINPAIISINGNTIGTIDNKNIMELDIIPYTERLFVTVTPVSYQKNALPFTYQINNSTTVSTDNQNIEIIPFPNNHFDIVTQNFYYQDFSYSKIILNQDVGDYFISIISDNSSHITIFSGIKNLLNIDIPKLNFAKVEKHKDLITIQGIIDSENYYLVVINTTDFNILFNDYVHSIEENINNIQVLKNLKDVSHHSMVTNISYSDKKIENYIVYENNICGTPSTDYFIPKDFLECIQIGDDQKARNYLCDNYQTTPSSQFKNYFGQINKIYINRHNLSKEKINYTILSNDQYKNYNFILENNKILDIEEVF